MPAPHRARVRRLSSIARPGALQPPLPAPLNRGAQFVYDTLATGAST